VGIDIVRKQTKDGSDGIEITDNHVANNADAGIHLLNSCSITVKSNDIEDNGGFAIDIDSASSNLLSGNTITTPTDGLHGGIRIYAKNYSGSNNCGPLDDASNNTVSKNDITMGTVEDHGNLSNINGTVDGGGVIAGEKFTGNDYHMPNGDCSVTNWKWWDGSTQRTIDFADWQGTYGQDPKPGGSCGA
jgi:parallel beta-helix repeat protein